MRLVRINETELRPFVISGWHASGPKCRDSQGAIARTLRIEHHAPLLKVKTDRMRRIQAPDVADIAPGDRLAGTKLAAPIAPAPRASWPSAPPGG